MSKGIMVKDGKGNELGLSKKAGFNAVMESSLSRFFIPFPAILTIMAMRYLSKFQMSKSKDALFQIMFCAIHLSIALPASIAIFKQYTEIPVDSLEEKLRDNARKFGSREAIYNKGL